MKKVLTILVVLALFAGFAFADGNTVTLTTKIAKISPTFALAVKDGDEYKTTKTVNDITAADGVTAEFKVSQTSDARVANGAYATLTVTCGEFSLYNENGDAKVTPNVSTAVPTISSATNAAVGARTNLSYNANAAVVSNVVTFTPKYAGIVAAGDIGTFSANWVQRTDLPAGTYKADVTLAYTAL